jgi:hypothetical protein
MKTRALAGTVVLLAGIALIGTSGLAFVLGWGLWAGGLAALLSFRGIAVQPSVNERARKASYARTQG